MSQRRACFLLTLPPQEMGGPIPLTIPAQQEVARKTSTPLLPMNWASHLLRGECQVGRTGKRSPKWRWLQTRKGKARENERKEGPRTGVSNSGKRNNTPGWPNLHRTGPGKDKHINRRARASSLSLSSALGRSSPRLFRSTCSHLKDGFSRYLLNKIEL